MAETKTVLVVEDEPVHAMDMEESLSELGWNVLGPAPTAERAFGLIEDTTPDIAILDYNIRGGTSEEIALALLDRTVPVVFLSGDNLTSNEGPLQDCPVLSKPVNIREISAVLTQLLSAQ